MKGRLALRMGEEAAVVVVLQAMGTERVGSEYDGRGARVGGGRTLECLPMAPPSRIACVSVNG